MQHRQPILRLVLASVVAFIVAGCAPTPAPSASPIDPTTGVVGTVSAGPVCPVERPGDPQCAPRAVADAQIVAIGGSGAVIAQATTDLRGTYRILIPAGAYTIEARAVPGLMGLPAPTPITVVAGRFATVDLQYDTGIR